VRIIFVSQVRLHSDVKHIHCKIYKDGNRLLWTVNQKELQRAKIVMCVCVLHYEWINIP